MNRNWRASPLQLRKREPATITSPLLFESREPSTSSTPDEVRKMKKELNCTPTASQNLSFHSTPIRSNDYINEFESNNNSPDFSSVSPVEPLTQHPPNEVGWDFHKDMRCKGETRNTFDPNRTPKRKILIPKRKNANSPLLHKPCKKQLIAAENKELASFKAELMSIKAKIEKKKELTVKQEVENINPDSQLDADFMAVDHCTPRAQMIVDDDSDIKLQVSALSDDSTVNQNATATKGEKIFGTENLNKVNSQNEDLLMDDSINDFMIKCTQQIEQEVFGSRNNSTEKKSSPDSSLERVVNNLSKVNVRQTVNNNNEEKLDQRDEEKKLLDFPDDSFDFIFTEFDETNLCKKVDEKNLTVSKNNDRCSAAAKNALEFFDSLGSKDIFATKAEKSRPAAPNVVASYGYISGSASSLRSNSVNTCPQNQFNNSNFTSSNLRSLKTKSSSFTNSQTNQCKSNSASNMKFEQKTKLSKHHSESSFRSNSREVTSSHSFGGNLMLNSKSCSNISANNIEKRKQFTNEEIEKKREEALKRRQAKLVTSCQTNKSLKRPIFPQAKR